MRLQYNFQGNLVQWFIYKLIDFQQIITTDNQEMTLSLTDTNLTPKFVHSMSSSSLRCTKPTLTWLVPCDNPPAPCLSNFWPMNVVFSFYQSHPLNLNIFMANCFRSATCREYVVNMFLW